MTEYFPNPTPNPELVEAFKKVETTRSKQPMRALSALSDFIGVNPGLLVIPLSLLIFSGLLIMQESTLTVGYTIITMGVIFAIFFAVGAIPTFKEQKLNDKIDETLTPDYEKLTEWFKNSYALTPIAGYYYRGNFQPSRNQNEKSDLLVEFLRDATMTPDYETSPVIHFVTKDGAFFNSKMKKSENGWLLEKISVSSPEENVVVPQTI